MVTQTEEKATMSVQELADLLGMTQKAVYRHLKDRHIPARQLGRRWLVSREVVMRWLNTVPIIPITEQ